VSGIPLHQPRQHCCKWRRQTTRLEPTSVPDMDVLGTAVNSILRNERVVGNTSPKNLHAQPYPVLFSSGSLSPGAAIPLRHLATCWLLSPALVLTERCPLSGQSDVARTLRKWNGPCAARNARGRITVCFHLVVPFPRSNQDLV